MAVPYATGPVVWHEDFPYADQSTGISPLWTTPAITAVALGVAGGRLGRITGSNYAGAVTVASFPRMPGFDFVAEFAVKPGDTNDVFIEILNGGATTSGYLAEVRPGASANDRFSFRRWSGGSVAATYAQVTDAEFGSTDALLIRTTDTTVEMARRLGGVWQQVGTTVTDTTLTAGRIGVETNSGLTRIESITVRRINPVLGCVGAGS